MIARKSLLPMANVVIGALLGLVALRVVALTFGPGVYGEFEGALAILGILFLFADLGMADAHVKRVSEGMHAGDCFVTYSVFRLAAAALFVLVSLSLLFLYTVVLGRTIVDVSTSAFMLVMVYYVIKSLQTVAQSTFDARLEIARSQLGSLVETVVRIGATILVAFVFSAVTADAGILAGRVDRENAVWRWVAENPAGAIAATWALGALVATTVLGLYLRRVAERGRFRWDVLRSYFAFGLPLFLPAAFGIIAMFIDRAVLTLFGTNVDTADFAGPRRIVGVVEGLGVALGVVLFPAISQAAAQNDKAAIARMMDRSSRYMSLLVMPIVAFLVFFPLPVIELILGRGFADRPNIGLVMPILAATTYLLVLARPHLNLLLGHGHAGMAARAGIVAGILTLTLNLVLVPDDIKSLGIQLFGLKAVGSAIATLVATAAGLALLMHATWRTEGYVERAPLWKHVLAGLAMGGAVWLAQLATGIPVHGAVRIVAYAALGTLVYAAALIAMREVTRDDVAYAKDTLHPGHMLRYLRAELGRGRE